MQDQPFIVGLGGTTRPGSTSERALRTVLGFAEAAGARTALLDGSSLKLPMYDPADPDRTAAARHLVETLRAADGLIIASPCYHGSLSGLVKNALDYTEDMRDDDAPYLDGRAVGCIVSAHGAQALGTTLVALRSIVHALRGWPTPFALAINSAEPDREALEADIVRQARILAGQVVTFAQLSAQAAAIEANAGQVVG